MRIDLRVAPGALSGGHPASTEVEFGEWEISGDAGISSASCLKRRSVGPLIVRPFSIRETDDLSSPR